MGIGVRGRRRPLGEDQHAGGQRVGRVLLEPQDGHVEVPDDGVAELVGEHEDGVTNEKLGGGRRGGCRGDGWFGATREPAGQQCHGQATGGGSAKSHGCGF